MKIKLKKIFFNVLNDKCIGRECFQPGQYQSRGATLNGSRNIGNITSECMRRAYHGCPTPLPDISKDIEKKRKKQGYRNSYL